MVAKVTLVEKPPTTKSIKKGGIKFGVIKRMTKKNDSAAITIDLSEDCVIDHANDIRIDVDTIDLSSQIDFDLFDVDFSNLDSHGVSADKIIVKFPHNPLATICDLKNKHLDNREIIDLLELFFADLEIPQQRLVSFYSPSDSAKEKAKDIKSHFASKFTFAALKHETGHLSRTRQDILDIIQQGVAANKCFKHALPLLVKIPDLYDEDIKLLYLQYYYRSEKSEYVEPNEERVTKTLYPVLQTERSGRDHAGVNYFWVDADDYVYRIYCERKNTLRPFLEYFFSKESLDFVIYNPRRNKIPAADLFLWDIKKFELAEIVGDFG